MNGNILADALFVIPPFLLAICFHEFSHALVATFLGDPTPKAHGRLTLNPFRHLDPIGTLFLFVFRIGWARPVIFNPLNFRYPRFYAVLTALAGPFSNLLLAFLSLFILRGLVSEPSALALYFSPSMAQNIIDMVKMTFHLNVMLGLFNLLPIPPLDGSHLVFAVIPRQWHIAWYRMQRYMIIILIVLFSMPATQHAFLQGVHKVKEFLYGMVF